MMTHHSIMNSCALLVNLDEEKSVKPLDGHLTITVGHMIYLLMWFTDSCLQIYSTKSWGTSDNKRDPKWKL